MQQGQVDRVNIVIVSNKEIIRNKNALFENIKDKVKNVNSYAVLSTSVMNILRDFSKKHKHVIQEEETITVDLNLPRNEYPISELEYKGRICPFIKTRLTIDEENNTLIKYMFNAGTYELDMDTLFEEIVTRLKEDNEFLKFKSEKWPDGFSNQSDVDLFSDD